MRRLDAAKIAIIRRGEGSVRAVARELGVGKSTVHYHRQKMYDEWEAMEPDAAEAEDSIPFERLSHPRRCPTHGLSWVWPCVLCSAKLGQRYE